MGFYRRADSPVQVAPRGPQRHKGSRKRIGRIRHRDHWSREIVIFWIALALFLLVVVPLLIRHTQG
jgi:hypothetical protein